MDTQLVSGLKQHEERLCVFSTVSHDSKPQCSVMVFLPMDDGSIVLSTEDNTRKWANIRNNPYVSIAVGWDLAKPFYQIEGKARQVMSPGEEYAQLNKVYFEANPKAKAFQNEHTVFIVVTPIWYRLSNYGVVPPTTEEKAL